jgi:hypothetical protein
VDRRAKGARHALDASWGNVVTYERDMEIVATYGMEDPAAAEEL